MVTAKKELPIVIGIGTATTKKDQLIQVEAPEKLGEFSVGELVSKIINSNLSGSEALVADNVRTTMQLKRRFFGRGYSIEMNGRPAVPSNIVGDYINNLPSDKTSVSGKPAEYLRLDIKVAPISRGGYKL